MSRLLLSAVAVLVVLAAACAPAATPVPTRAVTAATATPTPAVGGPSPTPAPTRVAPPTPKPTLQAGPKPGGTLTIHLRTDPLTWDPNRTTGGARDTRKQHNLVFDQLGEAAAIAENRCQAVLTPSLAKSWEWKDSTTLEVKLEQGVRFHSKAPVNGREMVAEDVVFSYKRIAEHGNWLQTLAKRISDAKAVDKYTVRFTTNGPFPLLPPALFHSIYGSVVMAPEAKGPDGNFENPSVSYIGTGPFQFESWVPSVKVTYVKNPNYWRKGQPYVDRIEQLVMPESSTRAAAMRAGKLSLWTDELPQPIAEELVKTTRGLAIGECPSGGGTNAVQLYFRTDVAPLNDVRVRRAISMAIDREAIVKAVYKGKGTSLGVFPPVYPVFLQPKDFPAETQKYLRYDPAEAKKLLAEAGYPQGVDVNYMVTKRYSSPWTEIAEAMGEMLTNVGVRVKWQWLDYAQYQPKITTGDFEGIAAGPFTAWDFVQALTRYDSRSGWAINRSRVVDPKMDRAVDQFLGAATPQESDQAARQVQILLADQAYTVTGTMGFDFSAAHDYVKGYIMAGQAESMNWARHVWLDR